MGQTIGEDATPAKNMPGRNALRTISGRKAGEDHARSQCPLRGDEESSITECK